MAGCHSFCLIFIFYNIHTFIHSNSYNTFIHRHSPGPLSNSSSLVSSVGQTTLWCRAENRTQACLPASRRATNWATPHHTEPRRTILSHAAPKLLNVQVKTNSELFVIYPEVTLSGHSNLAKCYKKFLPYAFDFIFEREESSGQVRKWELINKRARCIILKDLYT